MSDPTNAQVSNHEDKGQARAKEPLLWSLLGGSWSLFLLGLIIAVALGWGLWPTLLYSKKLQPFQFNHLVHTETAGMACDECHGFDEHGRFAGAPKMADCLECHTWSDRQNEDNERETAFLEEFVTEDDQLKKNAAWYSYAKQPDCVYFSHIAHVEKGGIACEECHGLHGKSTVPRPYYENRLTGYSRDVWEKMKMGDCADCHTRHGQPENNACFVCHK